MNNTTIQIKIKERLNKLDSQDYDNFECWQIVEAFNKAQIEWVRRQLVGNNILRQGDEQSNRKIDDLMIMLKSEDLAFTYGDKYVITEALPDDWMEFKRIDVKAVSKCCNEEKDMVVYLAEEANVSVLLNDFLRKPSFEWRETFATMMENKIKVFTNDEFEVKNIKYTYYKYPIRIQILGCADPYTLQTSTEEVECEFPDDVVEVLVDSAASILAGDIESFNQYTRESNASEQNN
jgi:hypothetical protein